MSYYDKSQYLYKIKCGRSLYQIREAGYAYGKSSTKANSHTCERSNGAKAGMRLRRRIRSYMFVNTSFRRYQNEKRSERRD